MILIFFILYPYIIVDILTLNKVPNLIIYIYDMGTKIFIIINVIYYMFIAKKNEKVFLYEKITNTRNISVIEKEENNEEIEEKYQEKTQQEDELCYNEKKKK